MSEQNEKLGSQEILSEVDLLELLNINRSTLDKLRLEKGLPYIRLDQRNRVYLRTEVLEWLREHLYRA